MLYAERDEAGRIIAIRKDEQISESAKQLSEYELFEFLSSDNETSDVQLRTSDSQVIRVLDDLIDVLISKNVIILTDLPEEACAKIGLRREIRNSIKKGQN